ncbi:MAG: cysteine--tRNA ligase, partial [Deltaproteobacteria bacterium]|nr:cysteine--tRNA ligase [Deltaproteobacteria bacterium]
LAMVAAIKGYRILLAMSEAVSLERRKILAALGAEFLLTPPDLGTDGAIEMVYEMAAEEPDRYHLTDQYNNPGNIEAHYHGTSREIWEQTGGKLTHFVASLGTTGTVMGNGKRLHELDSAIRVIAVEPHLGHRIQGLKNMKEAYQPGIFNPAIYDEKVNVDDDAAYETAREIARKEGILVGMSSGAAMWQAMELARGLDSGRIVVMLPDGGERYLSTSLFQVVADVEPPETHLRFLDSFTRKLEPFVPIKREEVTMYTCGPTVHAVPHIGLYRRVVVADLVRRTVELSGYPVKHVMNITDVDDRTIDAAEEAGKPLMELTEEVRVAFMADLETLRVKHAAHYPQASAHINDMVDLTSKLVDRGFAYEKLKSVYFDIGKFSDYGKLSGMDLEKVQLGATVDLDRYEKDDPRDFTLFKRSTLGEIKKGLGHRTHWGSVRPGWHIECAAMAMAHLGEEVDIHVGGVDLIFPHHENEIAICQSLTGKRPAHTWIHSGLVTVDRGKMSRAAGNAVTVQDLLERGYTGRQVRHFLLSTHYRQPLRFSYAALDAACEALNRLDECVRNLRALTKGSSYEDIERYVGDFEHAFSQALFDDLNVSAAFAALFQLVRCVNRRLAQGRLGKSDADRVLEALYRVDAVLALMPGEEAMDDQHVAALVREREAAREVGDYARADALRAEITAQGVLVEDTPQGPRYRRQSN